MTGGKLSDILISEREERKAAIMSLVKEGRKWIIENRADYDRAIEILEGNEFCAEMCDDYRRCKAEKAEIAKQRADVIAQAKAKGII